MKQTAQPDRFLEIRKRDYLLSRTLIVTYLGIAFQLFIVIPSFPSMLQFLNSNSIAFLFPYNATAFVFYFVFTIFYTYFVTTIFRPRRLVSPLWIQMGAVVTTGLVLLVDVFVYYGSPTLQLRYFQVAVDFSFTLVLSGMIAFMAGFAQYLFVRRIIGLSFENIDERSYTVAKSFETVSKTLTDPDFLYLYDLDIRQQTETIVVLERRVLRQRQTIVLSKTSEDQKSSIFGSYCLRSYFRYHTKNNQIIHHIRGNNRNS